MIRISEIYQATQGEGILLGERMPFVRVAGCNLSCSWCDSRYTWEPNYAYIEMTVDQVVDATLTHASGCNWVSITGGEPTLYPDLGGVTRELIAKGYNIIVETNGLACPQWLLNDGILVSCSPKLPNSGQDSPLHRQKVRATVDKLLHRPDESMVQFKFVIAGPEDLIHLLPYCEDVGIPTHPDMGEPFVALYLQPDGYVQPIDQYLEALAWLQDHAPPFFRVTPQIHRLIHGPDKKGV